MKSRIGNLSRLAGVAALSLGLMGIAGCGDNPIADACGIELDCPAKGLAEGNFSISGYAGIDAFFSSVLNFESKSLEVAGNLEADLKAIQAGFKITDAELEGDATLGAAIKAKFDANLEGGIKIVAEPPRCAADVKATFEAQAKCEASAECEVEATPPKIMVECKGSCEASASVMAKCEAGVKASCKVEAPSFECSGQCNGSCTVSGDLAAECTGSCSGTCTGSCSGTCEGDTDEGAGCAGACDGECKGSCDAECTLSASLTAECGGTCNGECTYDPGEASCDASATVTCEASADASVMCEGSCEGSAEPPSASASCEASASCQASAKADASVNVECTPPSVRIDYEFKAGIDAAVAADLEFGINVLRARLPKLLASVKKGDLVIKAGVDLIADAGGAVKSVSTELAKTGADAIAEADIKAAVKLGRVRCAVDELPKVEGIITGATGKLEAQVSAAASVQGLIGG